MRPTNAALVLLGAIASLAAGRAAAQDLPGYGPAPGYGGAARNYGDPDQTQSTDRHVTIDVIGDLIYDSNVARGSAADAAARHISQDDEIFTPTVAIDAYLPIGREALFLHGNAGYDFYRQDTVIDRERIDLHGGAMAHLGPCREFVTGDFNRQQSDLEELDLTTTKNTLDNEKVGFNAACGRAVGLAPFVGVWQQWQQNSAQLLVSSNYRTLGVDFGLGYARPALGSLQLFGAYRTTDFPDSLVLVGPMVVHDGYNLIAGGVTYDRRLGARIEGTVSASYTSLTVNIPGASGFSGFTYSVDVVYHASGRLAGHVRFDRATQPSNRPDSTFTIDEIILGDIQYKLGPRIGLSIGGDRDDRSFGGPASTIIPTIFSTHEIEYAGFGAATYTLSRRLSFTLDVRHIDRYANVPAFSYGDTRADLTVATTF